ncbi:MAG: hypothetical protein EA397_18955 [Deltaproteobacteria bacterium]|nr:MAG: hypothetical protein EA397_18955 [Deltaproteobacteria bacterium]
MRLCPHLTLLTLSAALTLSCDPDPTPQPSGHTGLETDTGSDSDTATVDERCEPDEDGDGWCPPEDCDDTTIWVNPSWAENPDDGIDNNCDGRIDEVFQRVFVLEWDQATNDTGLVQVDSLGDLRGTFSTGQFFTPTTATLDHDLRHFITFDPSNLALVRYDQSGSLETVASIDPEFDWPDDQGEPPVIFGDLVAHPDGYYLMAAADRLLRFETDGSWTVEARWTCTGDDHEFCATALGADPIYGTVMIFGFFGGSAVWTPDDGLEILQISDPEAPGPQFMQTHYKPFDTWFSLGIYYDEEMERENYGIFRFNRTTRENVLLGAWSDPNFQPNSFSIEEASGDFYFAVNSPRGAAGAWHNQVWRMSAQGGTTAQLFATRAESDQNYFVAAGVHYTHK